ncbi:hypothetical protein ACFX11_019070 [Malus domestica]
MYSVLINEASMGFIQPQRGLRQGDPMSPFLFLICAKGFSALLRMREEHGSIHGVRVAPSGVALTHLFFADDAIIFCKAKDEEVLLVMDVLKCYADASSQVINRDKSSLYFGANFSRQRRKQIASCTNIMGQEDFGKYLGIIADFRSLKKAVF